ASCEPVQGVATRDRVARIVNVDLASPREIRVLPYFEIVKICALLCLNDGSIASFAWAIAVCSRSPACAGTCRPKSRVLSRTQKKRLTGKTALAVGITPPRMGRYKRISQHQRILRGRPVRARNEARPGDRRRAGRGSAQPENIAHGRAAT